MQEFIVETILMYLGLGLVFLLFTNKVMNVKAGMFLKAVGAESKLSKFCHTVFFLCCIVGFWPFLISRILFIGLRRTRVEGKSNKER